MKATPSLTAERLREVLHYDQETGVFTWIAKPSNRAGRIKIGAEAGRVNAQGHRYIGVLGKPQMASRLAWLYVYGEWPDKCVVHVNFVSDDNRIANLRLSERYDMDRPLTADTLRSILHYDPETGVFTWKTTRGRCLDGERAGCVSTHRGYEYICIGAKAMLSHRLAWLYVYGEWPANHVDHINRVKTDNRIANLRLATNAENLQNTRLSRNNKSGYKGVIWYKRHKNWRAYLTVKREVLHLGYFQNLEDAVAARKAAEAKYHPFAPKDAQYA